MGDNLPLGECVQQRRESVGERSFFFSSSYFFLDDLLKNCFFN